MSQTIVSKRWKTDPEYTKLLNYLIERTKDAKSPIKIPQLIRDFKEESGVTQTERSLAERIKRMRDIIHSFEHVGTETKVRLLFVLGVPVNGDFLQELYKDAFVEVDEDNRITHYKSERLELIGEHDLSAPRGIKYWTTDKEGIELLNYLIRVTENVESPMSILQLARDFKEHNGTFQTAKSLEQRIQGMSFIIHRFEHIDKNTKVKLLFALSAPVSAIFLEELKERAFVEVDEKYRITYYEAIIDGLELSGYHSPENRKTELPGLKRSLVSTIDDTWGSCSSKRALSSPDYHSFHSFDDPPKFELEPFRGSIQEDLKEIEDDKDIQQVPKLPLALDEHTQIEEVTIKVEQEEPVENFAEPLEVKPVQTFDKYNELTEVPIKTEQKEPVEVKSEASHNSKIKFFEAMQSLIICIDTPSLSWIQSKIQQKINKHGGQDEIILNKEIIQVIELLVARMANHSVENLSKNVESLNLSNFFCYLKAAILNSKMIGVEGLVKNISELIEESQNKRILMENVANALRTTLVTESF